MSALHITVRELGEVTLLALKGSVTMGGGDLALRTTIKELVAKGHKKIVVDLEEVPYMDSTGLGELVAAYTSAKRDNAEIRLSSLTRKIQDLLGVVQLLGLFLTYPTSDEAVRSYG